MFPNGLIGWPTNEHLAEWDAQFSDSEPYSDDEAPTAHRDRGGEIVGELKQLINKYTKPDEQSKKENAEWFEQFMRQLREEAPQRDQYIKDLLSRNSATDTNLSPPTTTRWDASDHRINPEPYSGSRPKDGNRYCQGPTLRTPARSADGHRSKGPNGEKNMGNCGRWHGDVLN